MYMILNEGVPISRYEYGGQVYETVDEVCETVGELDRRFRSQFGWSQAVTPYTISLAPEADAEIILDTRD